MVTIVPETLVGTNATTSGHTYIIESGVVVGSNSGTAFGTAEFDDNVLIIDGIVSGTLGNANGAIDVTSGSMGTAIITGEDAIITGFIGIQGSGDFHLINEGVIFGVDVAVSAVDNGTIIQNQGTISSDDYAIFVLGNAFELENSGEIFGNIGIELDDTSSSADIVNNGSIAGDFAGIYSDAAQTFVVNNGTISSISHGIQFRDVSSFLINTGEIAGSIGVFYVADATGVNLLENSGTISGGWGGYAIRDDSGSVLQVTNSGVITSLNIAIRCEGSIHLENTGTIIAATQSAAIAAGGAVGGADIINNSGVIQGTISLGAFDDELTNQGTINGDISFGTGVNSVINSGSITGDIDAKSGDERIDNSGQIQGNMTLGSGTDMVRNSGDIIGEINLEGGDDVYNGGNGSVTGPVLGKAGEDVMAGGTGVDEFYGGQDSDLLVGNHGNDQLFGDDAADFIAGGEGDDLVDGGSGNDIVSGGQGDDVVDGGTGLDILTGGADADVFRFDHVDDSGLGTDRDIITDFEQGTDIIDFTGIAADLTFLGSAAFSGGGDAEIRVNNTGGTHSIVRLDADGDGNSDLEILILHEQLLTSQDFGL